MAMNEAAFNTRRVLVQSTWPSHVHQRNASFISYVLRVEKATKSQLRVEIYDQRGFDFIKRLETGGTKEARQANLAIPAGVKIGTRGVIASQKPRALANAFVMDRGRGPALWKRMPAKGKGKKRIEGKLKLMYVLKPSVQVGAMVPFEEDFTTAMRAELRTSFPSAMARAMKSRRS